MAKKLWGEDDNTNRNKRHKRLKWNLEDDQSIEMNGKRHSGQYKYSHHSLAHIERNRQDNGYVKLSKHKSETGSYDKTKCRDRCGSEENNRPRRSNHKWAYLDPTENSDESNPEKKSSITFESLHSHSISRQHRKSSLKHNNEFGQPLKQYETHANNLELRTLRKSRTSISEDQQKQSNDRANTFSEKPNKSLRESTNFTEIIRSAQTISRHKNSSDKRKESRDMLKQISPVVKNSRNLEVVSQVTRRGDVVVVQKRCERIHPTSSSIKTDQDKDDPNSNFNESPPTINLKDSVETLSYDPTSSLTSQSHRLYQTKVFPLTQKSERDSCTKSTNNSSSNCKRRHRRESAISQSVFEVDEEKLQKENNRRSASYDKPSITDKESTTRLERNLKGYNKSRKSSLSTNKSDLEKQTSECSESLKKKIIPIKSHKPILKQLSHENSRAKAKKRHRKEIQKEGKSAFENAMTTLKTANDNEQTPADILKVSHFNTTMDVTLPGFSDTEDDSKSRVSTVEDVVLKSVKCGPEKIPRKASKTYITNWIKSIERETKNEQSASFGKASKNTDAVDENYKQSAILNYFERKSDKEIPPAPCNSSDDGAATGISLESRKKALIQLYDEEFASKSEKARKNLARYQNIFSKENTDKNCWSTCDQRKADEGATTLKRVKTEHAFSCDESKLCPKAITLPVIKISTARENTNSLEQKDAIVTSNSPNSSASLKNSPNETRCKRKYSVDILDKVPQVLQTKSKLKRSNTIANCFQMCNKNLDCQTFRTFKSRSYNCLVSSFVRVKSKTPLARFKRLSKSPNGDISDCEIAKYSPESRKTSIPTLPSVFVGSEYDAQCTQQKKPNTPQVHVSREEHKPDTNGASKTNTSSYEIINKTIQSSSQPKRSQPSRNTPIFTCENAPNRDDIAIDGESRSECAYHENSIDKSCWHYDKTQPWYNSAGKGLGFKILMVPIFLIIGPFVWACNLFNINSQFSRCWKESWYIDKNEYWFSCKGKGRGWRFLLIPMYVFLGPLIFIFTLLTVILLSCCGGNTSKRKAENSRHVNNIADARHLRRSALNTVATSNGRHSVPSRPVLYGTSNA